MSYNLGTEDDPVIVFVNFAGGIFDAVIRADDEATFLAAAKYAELYFEVMDNVTDEETGDVTQVGSGVYEISKGVDIDPIGPVMLTAGTYDDDGGQITAPTFDTRYHVNVRMMSPAIDRADEYGVVKWHKWAMAWTLGGADLTSTNTNAGEVGKTLQNVSLIDPSTISSPSRVWL
jgi:hypothetical protein